MKNILLSILLFANLKSFSQTDSTALPITVTLPVKAIVLYATQISQAFTIADRKAPDALVTLIGSGNQPDSLVTITITSGKLSVFVNNLLAERYGVIVATTRSVVFNLPAISGYTALATQITTLANGNGAQKGAAQYVLYKYQLYSQSLVDEYNTKYASGLAFIRAQ